MPAPVATTSMPAPPRAPANGSSGIARLLDDPPAALADYVGAGAVARPLSRLAGDRARSAAARRPPGLLRTASRGCRRPAPPFRRRRQVAVHHRDAWEALGALLPPKERRGLVLIDPPFEDPHEFAQLAARPRRRLAALPHRRVRRLVSDQAARAGAAVPGRSAAERHARHRGRRTVPARAGRSDAAQRLRHAGGQSALSLRAGGGGDPGGAARPAGRSRSRARPPTVTRIADE